MKKVDRLLVLAFVGLFLIVLISGPVKAGPTPPICNASDPNAYRSVALYHDYDNDGYGAGSPVFMCIGNDIPAGYSTNNLDCNDSDPSVWIFKNLYHDIDLDGHGAGNATMMCIGNIIPLGYSNVSTDCNDNDPSIWHYINGFLDRDKDGYGDNNAVPICSGNSLPQTNIDQGYTNVSGDCEDTNPNIHPGATELCNGKDDNCNGKVDETFQDKGQVCYAGIGECKNAGVNVCNLEGNGTFCKAIPKKPSIEICDGKDNNCDGQIDEGFVCNQTNAGLFVFSPIYNIYNTKKIMFNISTGSRNARSITYIDNLPKSKELILCTNCNSIDKYVQFIEGNHSILIKAIFDNEIITNKKDFFIDATIPKVTNPKILKIGYTNGSNFIITYSENNLANVSLVYSIDSEGIYGAVTRTDCLSGKNVNCSLSLDFLGLSKYEGKTIKYNFVVTDIANNKQTSKIFNALIDTTLPIITNPDSMFIVTNNRVSFNMNIVDLNFKDVSYIDPIEKNPRWKLICSRLVNDYCTKTLVFTPGNRTVTIKVSDKAGNYVLYYI